MARLECDLVSQDIELVEVIATAENCRILSGSSGWPTPRYPFHKITPKACSGGCIIGTVCLHVERVRLSSHVSYGSSFITFNTNSGLWSFPSLVFLISLGNSRSSLVLSSASWSSSSASCLSVFPLRCGMFSLSVYSFRNSGALSTRFVWVGSFRGRSVSYPW